MSITVRDCLQLPSLSLGKVVAGHLGLERIVNTVSVMEFDWWDDEFSTTNELVLTAFYCIRDNIESQCKALENFQASGSVGLVLFYADHILNGVSPLLIETANRLEFPMILLPCSDMNLRYSDVINDVMEAVFLERKEKNHFVNSTIKRLSQLSPENRSIRNLLQMTASYSKASFFLYDGNSQLISFACWPNSLEFDYSYLPIIFKNKSKSRYLELESKDVFPGYHLYRMKFEDVEGTSLQLFAATKGHLPTPTFLKEVADAIQLFCSLWNYNLDLSSVQSLIPAILENDQSLVYSIAKHQNLNLSTFNTLFVVDIKVMENRHAVRVNFAKQVQALFDEHKKVVVVDVFSELVLILSSFSLLNPLDNLLWEELSHVLNNENKISGYALFPGLTSIVDVRHAFLNYCEYSQDAKIIYPLKNAFTSDDIAFAEHCKTLFSSVKEAEYFSKLLNPVIQDSEEGLLLTLSTYLLDANSEKKKTSEILYVHRNTIQYRLNKIKKLLNREITKMPFSYDLYVAVAMYRLNNKLPSGFAKI